MKNKKFCENCGKKLNEDGICSICDSNGVKKKNNFFKIIFDVIRYIIGGFIILGSLNQPVNFSWTVFILFGISLLPIVYRKIIPKIFKTVTKRFLVIMAIVLPIVLFIIYCASLLNEYNDFYNDDFYNDNFHNDNFHNFIDQNETEEDKLLRQIILNLADEASLDSHDKNSDDKYDLKIKYTKSNLSAYTCAYETQDYVKNFIGNKKINSIQFECIKNSETFYYVKVENIDTLTNEDIETNTKYFDNNFKEINTNLKQLEANQVSDYKKTCKSYKYKDVLRNPENYQDQNAYWFGRIVQVVGKTSYYSEFRIDVTCQKYTYIQGYSCSDTIYVTYFGNQSFIEDDMVKMWGTMDGTETYTTVLGASVTIPKFNAVYMELQ